MWYRIGIATSVSLRFMDPGGYEWRQSHLYCSTGQNKCNNRETSGNRVGKI